MKPIFDQYIELRKQICEYFGVGPDYSFDFYLDDYWSEDGYWSEEQWENKGEDPEYSGEFLRIYRKKDYTLAFVDHGTGDSSYMIFSNEKEIK